MPVHRTKDGGWQWGETGKVYYGKNARRKAEIQGYVIEKRWKKERKHKAGNFVSDALAHSDFLAHHGVVGMRWGIKNGPPYPLDAAGQLRKVKAVVDTLNKKFDYGVIIDGKRYVDDMSQVDFSKYRTMPVNEFKRKRIGTCWDFVNYQHDMCKKSGYPDKNYMVVARRSKDPDDVLTHTFTVVEIGGKQYWMESARWKDRGVHEVSSYKDVVKKLKEDDFGDKPYDVYEFNPDGMDKGLTDGEYFDRATDKSNLVYTSQDRSKYKKIE